MLSFRIKDAATIEIDCDAPGIARLIGALAHLVGERASHVHLRATGEPGTDLDDKTPWNEDAVTEVIINYVEGD
jgi:hypothetical protein